MAQGNIPLRWFKEPWTEERAGEILSHQLGVTFPAGTKPLEWISNLVKLIPNQRHRQFFMMRYGLMDDKFHTYTSIASENKVSRVRAYQIDMEILERLRKKLTELQPAET